MEIFIIILLLISLVFNGIVLYLHFIPYEKENVKLEEPKKPKLTQEEKDKQEKMKKSFDNLMNYDEKIARSRK